PRALPSASCCASIEKFASQPGFCAAGVPQKSATPTLTVGIGLPPADATTASASVTPAAERTADSRQVVDLNILPPGPNGLGQANLTASDASCKATQIPTCRGPPDEANHRDARCLTARSARAEIASALSEDATVDSALTAA